MPVEFRSAVVVDLIPIDAVCCQCSSKRTLGVGQYTAGIGAEYLVGLCKFYAVQRCAQYSGV